MHRNFKHLHQVMPKHLRVLNLKSHRMPHNIYPQDALETIKVDHVNPNTKADWVAYYCIKFIRKSFDFLTRYNIQKMTEKKWVNRCLFLETIAGVPGMCGGMCRHLRSLRLLKRDKGWIHHLLQEADNQRFHLIIFLNLKKPGYLMRLFILAVQGVFMNSFFLAYLIKPRFCHRFVGYLQQEAVKTYTALLRDIDRSNGILNHWAKMPAPSQAISYYHFQKEATMRDVILAIRADEATHRQSNHFFAEVDQNYDIEEEPTFVYDEKKDRKEIF